MATTGNPDTESPQGDLGRLRVDVYKRRCARKKALRVEDQAELFEVHKAHIYRLLNGERIASLPLAFHMAKKLGTKVEKLFVSEVSV